MERITGLDVARGLAVLGMIAAHVGDDWPWLWVLDGRSAATFATLAGVSAAIMSRPSAGGVATGRSRVARRGLAIGVIGLLLYPFTPAIADILPTYAVMFVALAPLLGLPDLALLGLAGAFATLGPLVVHAAQDAAAPDDVPWPTDLLVGHFYPAAVWMAYLLVGVVVGRTDLRSTHVRVRLAAVGTGLATVGYGVGIWAGHADLPETWTVLLDITPHASTTPEVVGNIGVVLAVLALCLLLGDTARGLLAPIAATGSLALSAYVAHLLAIAALGPESVWDPDGQGVLVGLWLTVVAASWAWRTWLGRGPLERLVHDISTTAPPPERLPPG